jgi:hypothetical protein
MVTLTPLIIRIYVTKNWYMNSNSSIQNKVENKLIGVHQWIREQLHSPTSFLPLSCLTCLSEKKIKGVGWDKTLNEFHLHLGCWWLNGLSCQLISHVNICIILQVFNSNVSHYYNSWFVILPGRPEVSSLRRRRVWPTVSIIIRRRKYFTY